MTTAYFNHLPTQHNDLQRKYHIALDEIDKLRRQIAGLEAQITIAQIELRKSRAALAPVTNSERKS